MQRWNHGRENNLKPGDIVYVKTTGQPGFVQKIQEVPGDGIFNTTVTLSLASGQKEGGYIYGELFDFYIEELETAQERIKRDLDIQIYEYDLKEVWRERKRKELESKKQQQLMDEFDGELVN